MRTIKPWMWAVGIAAALALASGGITIIKWLKPPFSGGVHKRTQVPRGIVLHWTVTSSAASTLKILQNRDLATAYEVGPDGTVYEYVDPALWYTDTSGGGANAATIGIDITHKPGQPWSAVQLASLRTLMRQLSVRFGFPLVVAPDGVRQDWAQWAKTPYTVLRHRNLRPTECPGDLPVEALV